MNDSEKPKDIGLAESASTSVISASTVESASSVKPASTVEPASNIQPASTVTPASKVQSAGTVAGADTVEPASNVQSPRSTTTAGAPGNTEDDEEWDSDSEPEKPDMRSRGGIKQPVGGPRGGVVRK